MRKLLGYGLCVLGAPSLFCLLLGMAAHVSSPTSGDIAVFIGLIPFAIVGLPFLPLMRAGLKLLSDPT